MRSIEELDALHTELTTHMYNVRARNFTHLDAHKYALRAASHDRSDPFVYSRVRSGLMQGHITPHDVPRASGDAPLEFDR